MSGAESLLAEALAEVGADGRELLAEAAADADSGRGKAALVAGGGKKLTSSLAECCVDLTELARAGKLDEVAGREEEVARALQVRRAPPHTHTHTPITFQILMEQDPLSFRCLIPCPMVCWRCLSAAASQTPASSETPESAKPPSQRHSRRES